METTAAARQQADAGRELPVATLAELHEIVARYPHSRSALLPMLHLLQSVQGRVTAEGIETCAAMLDLSTAEVSGVATFYTMYKRRPVGDYHVGVCTNTLCAVMGGDLIFERLKDHLGVGNDETTDDGKITLEHVECNAACDYAPVVMVNWEFFDNQTPESAAALVDELMAGNEVRATRGARVCTWREAERVLAGFPDDRADEGPSAGPASLAGLRLARERDWRAPQPDRGAADGDVVAADQASKDASEEPDVAVAASPAGTRHEDQEQSRDADSRAETSNGSNRKTDS
ncbi:MAG: NADH-quinone oxidoreductase subunit NuoE [Actinomycetota bacterium]|nr:NADH-quinone oxidoreductase subunit NuoE [Actinomycetota bacterium]